MGFPTAIFAAWLGMKCISAVHVVVGPKVTNQHGWLENGRWMTMFCQNPQANSLSTWKYVIPKSTKHHFFRCLGGCWEGRVLFKIWVFPKIVVLQNGWFIRENPIKMDDLGCFTPIFGSTPICFLSCSLPINVCWGLWFVSLSDSGAVFWGSSRTYHQVSDYILVTVW